MVSLDDIISDLEANGNTVTNIETDGIVYTIRYLDSTNTEQFVKYKIDILDDGSESLTQI